MNTARFSMKQAPPFRDSYSAGNDAASIFRGAYPGPGITLGPALTFGYLAGLHLSGRNN